jgi:hypothetical protein
MERELPAQASGFVDRILAFDRYSGESSKVSLTAYHLYLKRQRMGIVGTAEEDWLKAEKIVKRRVFRELNQKLAQSQAI